MFTVYILHSESKDKFYIGQSSDFQAKLIFHSETATRSYTSKYRPWSLFWSVKVDSRSKAMKLEQYLKKKPSIL